MDREDALKLIPPGWVECDFSAWSATWPGVSVTYKDSWGTAGRVYAIPAPKPEPRRVPCGEMVMEFAELGYLKRHPSPIRDALGGYDSLDNTKWRLDFDTREWVEVLE